MVEDAGAAAGIPARGPDVTDLASARVRARARVQEVADVLGASIFRAVLPSSSIWPWSASSPRSATTPSLTLTEIEPLGTSAGRNSSVCFGHRLNDVLGKVISLTEDAVGVKMVAKLNRQPESSPLRWIYEAVRKGTIKGLSVGARSRDFR